ncbi:MAG: cadmium-translocating P-type ATPase [Balneolales bacterium]|nr:cadmium-translocating P-type ATPase [Balneolales bacterium]
MTTPEIKNPETLESESRHIWLEISGMSCASCVAGVEKSVLRLDGVSKAEVNLATEQASVYFDPEKVTQQQIAQAISDAGYEASIQEDKSTGLVDTELNISGMTCASCVAGVEKAIGRVSGTSDISVNLATETARFRAKSEQINPIIKAIQDAGYEASYTEPAEQNEEPVAQKKSTSLSFKRKFWIALPLAILVSIMDMGPMFIPAWHDAVHPILFQWNLIQLVLTSFILFYAGNSFFTGAWKSARHLRADMNTLVALGTGSALLFSAYAVFWGVEGGFVTPMDVYFDTAAIIIALILLGKWMEERARHQSRDALSGLMELYPQRANKYFSGSSTPQTVPLSKVNEGDRLLVKAYEQVPVDGILLDGSPSIDESMMTGESLPVDKTKGAPLTGGTRNTATAFVMQATAVGSETALSQIIETVKTAQGSKPPIQRLVDKVSAVFVPVVIAIALLTLIGWTFIGGDPAKALVNMVAVLIIACPCALGLATPTGIMVGSARAAEKGILIKDAVTLEEARKIDTILLDKTGTLTKGKMKVRKAECLTDSYSKDEMLRLAASLEQESDHPVAQAIVAHARELGLETAKPSSSETLAGTGIKGVVKDHTLSLGSVELLDDENDQKDERFLNEQNSGATVIIVKIDGDVAGYISVGDEIREDAKAFISRLKKMGIKPVMLTGDQYRTAAYVAGIVGIDEVIAEVKPREKAAAVEKLQKQEMRVAMVGDGINDAAALVQADLGIALAGGTDLAMSSADITIMGESLDKVAEAIALSRGSLRIIRQNLFWAFVYNSAGIPLAAAGILSPVFAAAAMALSSVSVVSNSLRIKRL